MTSKLKKWPILSLLESDFISNIHMVLVYGDLGNCWIIVTKHQKVHVLGNVCHGYVERKQVNDQSCPKTITIPCAEKIKTIAHGNQSYVLLLTENGKMYSCGSWSCITRSNHTHGYYKSFNNCGCDYSGLENIQINNMNEDFVVDIACGNYHSMALTHSGNVYVWGESTIGRKVNNIQSSAPVRVNINTGVLDVPFRSISCGANHCMAVTCNGHVFSWGSNSNDQLGVNNIKNYTMAHKVTYLSGIVIEKVTCGKNHTLALSDKGTLYCWGDNTYGQLGVMLEKQSSMIPRALTCLLKVLDMAASNCANISVAMTIDHQIFMWGECLEQIITIPTLISVESIHDAFALYASPRAMHQPFVIDNEEKKEEGDEEIMNITDYYITAFDDESTSDLTITVKGKPIYVHKPILKIRSKYFDVMFQGGWKENQTSVIKISEFSYKTYRAFLEFLYTNKIDETIPTANVLELLKLVDCYNDDNVKASYMGKLTQRISTSNTALLYSVAVQYKDTVLKRRCIRFAVRHMNEISRSSSFAQLTQETMKNFIIEVVDQGAFDS